MRAARPTGALGRLCERATDGACVSELKHAEVAFDPLGADATGSIHPIDVLNTPVEPSRRSFM
jgi:hypothetical protein